eukprot:TRINITY_DN19923_c3_g1_i1.p1 TRINITY_DN19923_c3_g1~~TRINITY_DN19923_c3_g1_i1.p1  ORF type:complete len:114 (-),score=24.21 TRINITY_DN19923_c3_g1_i1:19-360(-)
MLRQPSPRNGSQAAALLLLGAIMLSMMRHCDDVFVASRLRSQSPEIQVKASSDSDRQPRPEDDLPDWLMESTGGAAKETGTERQEGVDMGWDYRVVGAVLFAAVLFGVGIFSG